MLLAVLVGLVSLSNSFLLTGKDDPLIHGGGAFFATAAGLDTGGVGGTFDYVAKTDVIVDEKTRQTDAMRLMLWCFRLVSFWNGFVFFHDAFLSERVVARI